ncbi:endonuclease/exonuclease/phosphatase family protein [Actinomadura opuntiae]|uniref:endonuclease/exonuclease/phosphatase family protein n=1 Tax=Actinomadura sp. OS1-43 TaxID=604315 RepID=UPI00255AB857|nr:endonuclease/exonuclease/phosphatase family protein [Actinomadura sp. OS1-43]MDL4818262.1 endonuclease/exonuclease/phosphatase family protein [Actinomadura sp. OS1-43]
MKFALLTFNTLFRGDSRARTKALGRILEESPYDVVCLQEVISPLNLMALRRTARSYPHIAHGPLVPLVHGGLVTLSRHPITRRYFRPYTFAGPRRPEHLMRKGVLLTRVRLGDEHVTIANTHLSANKTDDWSRTNPYAQAEASELAELTGLLAHPTLTDPLVVAGDFNVPRNSPILREFIEAARLRDVLDNDPATTYRPSAELPGPKPIDQILASPPLRATTSLVFKEKVALPDGRLMYLSDHYGIAATFA